MRYGATKNIVAKTLLVCGFLVMFNPLCHGADYTDLPPVKSTSACERIQPGL